MMKKLTRQIALEHYNTKDNPIKNRSVFWGLFGGVGTWFLLFGFEDSVFSIVGFLLLGIATIIVFFSVKAYFQGRRELLSEACEPVEVTCLSRKVTAEVLGDDSEPTPILYLRFIDQAGRSYDWSRSSPSPELEAITEGKPCYLVALKNYPTWRTFQIYPADEWELDW